MRVGERPAVEGGGAAEAPAPAPARCAVAFGVVGIDDGRRAAAAACCSAWTVPRSASSSSRSAVMRTLVSSDRSRIDAHVVAMLSIEQLLVGESLAGGVVACVEPRVDRLQRFGDGLVERGERDGQLLRLLLQHAASAAICWCSRFCAAAGDASGQPASASARWKIVFFMSRDLIWP